MKRYVIAFTMVMLILLFIAMPVLSKLPNNNFEREFDNSQTIYNCENDNNQYKNNTDLKIGNNANYKYNNYFRMFN